MGELGNEFRFTPAPELVAEHRQWLGRFDPRRGKQWDDMLQADPEAAMSEARVRLLLEQNGNQVEPNQDLNDRGKSPDFICRRDGKTFYVEATSISIASATDKTGLAHIPVPRKAQSYAPLNNAIFAECCNKTPQCAGLAHPCLVVVCTFHYQASVLCVRDDHLSGLLTGEPLITWDMDLRVGRAVGDPYQSTQLRSATFLKPDDGQPVWARLPISGVLVCGFGCDPPSVLGVLHPEPKHPFDPTLLPSVRMGQVTVDREASMLSIRWPDEAAGRRTGR